MEKIDPKIMSAAMDVVKMADKWASRPRYALIGQETICMPTDDRNLAEAVLRYRQACKAAEEAARKESADGRTGKVQS